MRYIEQTEAARDGAVVFGALELSKSAWLLAAQGSPSGKASSHRLDRGDVAGLLWCSLACTLVNEQEDPLTVRRRARQNQPPITGHHSVADHTRWPRAA